MLKLEIPEVLEKGDKIATVSLSWGGPGTYKYRYEAGKKELEKKFGIEVIEMQNTLKSANFVHNNPKKRAEDLMNALKNKYIKAIFSTIGGDDSIRILPYIDFEVIKNNPKIFMGYSDSTITHFIFYYAGIRSYYGPSIMGGFDENCGIYRYMEDSIYKTLFINEIIGEILQNTNGWTSEFLDWNNKNNSKIKRNLNKENSNWRFLQGEGKIYGELLGGCIDVFPFMWGTKIWPEKKKWKGKILFFETSEEKISEIQLERILRVLGIQGILQNLNGIIVGKSIDGKNYDKTILKIVNTELSLNLPIITNMDFGHIHPVFILPIGAKAELDFENKKFSILESGVK